MSNGANCHPDYAEYHKKLKKVLDAEKAYYEEDKPIMSDSAYDALFRDLIALEKKHPEWADANSPTKRVGGTATSTFAKITFPTQMLSLKNAFTDDELRNFIKGTLQHNLGYVVQPKLDGLTLVLCYEKGALLWAATRGNGTVGEDVTANATMITGIPKFIPNKDRILIRGEVVLHQKIFERLNKQRAKEGKQLYANARNVAAGSVRQKDPNVTKQRHLNFYAYDMPGITEDFPTETSMLQMLNWYGFTTPRTYVVEDLEDLNGSVISDVHSIKEREGELDYAIDGAVVKTLSRGLCRTELGCGTHDPNWAIAFKFTPVSVCTTLRGVVWQIGRKGTLTPVAVLDPVDLCGTTVTHASLHNEDYIRELGLHIGDQVTVYKAAEIIPQIDCVVERMNGPEVTIPKICPECGAALKRIGAALVCTNEECTAKLKAEIRYFVSRPAMDIIGVAAAVIDELVNLGKLHSPADLYKLKKAEILVPGLIAETKAHAIVSEIRFSKDRPFHKVLTAIGINGVAASMAALLAKTFKTMDALNNATKEQLTALDGVADTLADTILKSLHSEKKQTLIKELTEAGLKMTYEEDAPTGVSLAGSSFCITGTLSVPREKIIKLISDNGGTYVASLSSKTTYLVAGENCGSKKEKAEKLGVQILSEQQLREMIQ